MIFRLLFMFSLVLTAAPPAVADRAAIAFTTFTDTLPVATGEKRRVLTTAAAYRNYFGHAAPASVNFRAGDWVVLYDAGTKTSGGYVASIVDIRRSDSGRTLKIETRLRSPGLGCPVTLALTRPSVLARFRAPTVPAIEFVQFFRDDVNAPSCLAANPSVPDPCGVIRCAQGYRCEEVKSNCITPPCAPVGQCVPNTTCASVRCAEGHQCIQDGAALRCEPDARGACATDADCRLSDNFCGGCECDALGSGQSPTTCTNPIACFLRPCQDKVAKCSAGKCVVAVP